MIAITTSSSTSVKPRDDARRKLFTDSASDMLRREIAKVRMSISKDRTPTKPSFERL